jgi:hypothetical protein
MNEIKEIISNIKSIAFFLSSKKDIDLNEKLKTENKENRELPISSDIKDLKFSDLNFQINRLNYLVNKIMNEKEKPIVSKIKICVASSETLEEERLAIEKFLFKKNDELIDKNIYLSYNVWEKQSHRFNNTYKQLDFNDSLVLESDIFICLIGNDVGRFTKEEFDLAKERFSLQSKLKPFIIYVYFKDSSSFHSKETEKEGWNRRNALRHVIEKDYQQIIAEFLNKDQLINKIGNHIDQDIQIVLDCLNATFK